MSVPVYERVLGSAPATTMTDGPFTRRVFALPGGQGLGLTQHATGSSDSFDPTPQDLITSASPAPTATSCWPGPHLDRMGVAHSGVQDAEYGSALSFTDPDGNALEFFASA